MSKNLVLYNSLSRKKEIFRPIKSNNIRMYVCGPTVYDRAHIGNARPVLVFDLLFRLLRHLYGDKSVKYVRNFTDVDDKINKKAREKKVSIESITEKTIQWFHEDMDQLGALRPTHEPRATQYISQMIVMISELVATSYAYATDDGHVFFSVEAFDKYGHLSKKDSNELLIGSRIENEVSKKNPLDFVLWKPSAEDDPGWQSPWGLGRPGWHIECSAMSRDLLGEHFDIHGGGIDLIFPHHENEIAQSVCANNNKFANFWLHNGFLKVDNQKMSKSLHNFITVKELIENDFSGQAIRYVMFSTQYRQPINWTYNRLNEAEKILDRWNPQKLDQDTEKKLPKVVLTALLNDLNTPQAISEIHRMFNKDEIEDVNASCKFFGFQGEEAAVDIPNDPKTNRKIGYFVKLRNQARQNKDFKTADKIRNDLLSAGIVLSDKGDESSWKINKDFRVEKLEKL